MFNTYLVFQGDRRENFEQQIGQLDTPGGGVREHPCGAWCMRSVRAAEPEREILPLS